VLHSGQYKQEQLLEADRAKCVANEAALAAAWERCRQGDNPNTGTAERHRELSRSIRASGGSPVSAPAWGETTAETWVTQTLAEIGVKYASVAMKGSDPA
jgi:hypothetical protein